uniref:sulfotransferase domain-containing protein n=1 Tax=Cellvibrio fontiphilus TaxID=1815559 RepID=UPI002B4BCA83|nr:sulfotransferase domain-containing protein [Cellvibrio fontiphilus]
MSLPLDFMIVGVQKGGTTALAHFLAQHPQLTIAEGKEVHLFDAPDYSSSWTIDEINQRYLPHFQTGLNRQMWGEATPIYIYWPEIAAELQRYNPRLKLIVILRDPVKRALSQYNMERARGDEKKPLWLALLLEVYRLWRDKSREPGSARRCHSYCSRGHYAKQLKNLRLHFTNEQILVIDNSELLDQHEQTLRKVYDFLTVPEIFLPDQERVFNGDYATNANPFIGKLLKVYFRFANRKLRRQLNEMGYNPNWSWL